MTATVIVGGLCRPGSTECLSKGARVTAEPALVGGVAIRVYGEPGYYVAPADGSWQGDRLLVGESCIRLEEQP